jgi:drug efflux transport system ATP-binding protein
MPRQNSSGNKGESVTGSRAIIIDSLIKRFNSITALDNLDLTVKTGEMNIIVGPDGAGKTTLLRILAGILPFDHGKVRIFDCNLPKQAEKAKLKLGYMPQRFGLYEDLTVQENLSFFYDLYCLPKSRKHPIFESMYSFSNLEQFKNRLAGNLSGGMKQKLGLACVLMHKPSVLLLDEPTNGVDPHSRRTFWNILSEFKKQGVTIVVATPFMDEAERGDKVLMISNGQKLAFDTPENIKTLWRGALYMAHSEDSRYAKEILDKSGLIKTSVLYGNKIHFVPVTEQETRQIKKLLEKENLIVGTIQKIYPELEDLYISLVSDEK